MVHRQTQPFHPDCKRVTGRERRVEKQDLQDIEVSRSTTPKAKLAEIHDALGITQHPFCSIKSVWLQEQPSEKRRPGVTSAAIRAFLPNRRRTPKYNQLIINGFYYQLLRQRPKSGCGAELQKCWI
jgi:hypothetical protein